MANEGDKYRFEKLNCPVCSHKLDSATKMMSDGSVGGPAPGDVTVCLYCTSWLEFGPEAKSLEILEQKKMEDVAAQPWFPEFFAKTEEASRLLKEREAET
jgi:hypothetical protein